MLISVIIPVYNSERTISRCIESILAQEFKDFEIIIIDDGSIDNSWNILSNYNERFEFIQIYKQKNSGPGIARNLGIEKSKGEYIVFVDSDDYIEKDYFKEVEIVLNNEEKDVIFIDILQKKTNGEILKEEKMSKFKNCSKHRLICNQMTGNMPWGGCRKVVRKKIITDNKVRYSNDKVGEEAIFSFKVLTYAQKIYFLEKNLYNYINYDKSQSKKGGIDPWGRVVENMKKHIQEIGEYEVYKESINSFKITSDIVAIDRTVKILDLKSAYKLSRIKRNNFINGYSFESDRNILDKRVRYLSPLYKWKQVWLIVLISKVKNLLRNG